MRAILIREPGSEDVLVPGDAPDPPLGPADLRIRVHATAVNRADLLQRMGLYPPPPGASPILGLECAGEVIETGPKAVASHAGSASWRSFPAAATPSRRPSTTARRSSCPTA
jgi:NADPH:quinone reductase-like Zn-dependent oxidoreductase